MNIEGLDNQTQQDVLSSEELIQSLQPSEAPVTEQGTPPADDKIGGIERAQLLGALKEIGVEVPDIDVLRTRYEAAGQVDSLRTQLQQLEAKSKLSPYHTPLSEAVDRMTREGKTPADIMKFVELSSLEVDKLDPIESIQRHYEMTKPGYTKEQVQALIARDLGFDPNGGEELSALETATLKERQEAANAFLKQQQASASNPEAVQQAQQRQQTAESYLETWNKVIPMLAPNADFKVKIEDQEIAFGYKPSSEALEAARKAIAETVAANPLAFPPSKDTAASLQEMMEQVLFIADRPRYLEAMANHYYSVATAEAAKRYSGNGAPLVRNNGSPQTVPNASTTGGIPAGGWIGQ